MRLADRSLSRLEMEGVILYPMCNLHNNRLLIDYSTYGHLGSCLASLRDEVTAMPDS